MRIVSLLPSCTDWVRAFGAQHLLVGRSHECDVPASDNATYATGPAGGAERSGSVEAPSALADIPVVTGSTVSGGDSASIDRAVRERLNQGLSVYDVDLDLLADLKPDLILTQTQCDVCAVPRKEIEAGLTAAIDPAPDLFSFDATTFKEVLQQALNLGKRIGRTAQAMAFIAERERELKLLRASLALERETPAETLPTVACIEWLEPLMTSGNWVPDLVEMAGGRAVCAEAGAPSETVSWEAIVDADPEVIVVVPCGYAITSTENECSRLSGRKGWDELRAVRDGKVFLLDGRRFANRPGPALYRSIELLASALHTTDIEIGATELTRMPTVER